MKQARSLHQRKNRYRERAFLVEGVRLFLDALDAEAVPQRVFVRESDSTDQLDHALSRLQAQQVPVHRCTENVINVVADTQTPQGIIAIFGFPDLPIVEPTDDPLILVLDGLKDPGNAGTLMRAALGAGVAVLLVSAGTVDPYSPKVVRAAMGAHFRLPLRQFDWSDIPGTLLDCADRYAADAGAPTSYDHVNWRDSCALIVGGEASGLSQEAHRIATRTVSIPLSGGLESLNVGVAGAVILFEAARQRRSQ